MQWVIVCIALLISIGTSVLSWDAMRTYDLAPRFHWPDETTNWYFADRVAHGESLVVPESRNATVGNLIHPRTANVRSDGAIVPGAYLGLPLWYGLVGRLIGSRAMLLLTPLLAGAALLGFARIVAVFWDRRTALIATLLLALHVTIWMFTATAFLPNIPFLALLLMGLAAVLHKRGHVAWWLCGGLLIGFALTFRTHEALWVLTLAGAIAWRQRATVAQGVAAVVGLVLPFIPILILNAQLYGSPFTTGYALLHAGGAPPTEFAGSGGMIRAFLFPFGVDIVASLQRFWQYMVVPYWWFMALAIVGLFTASRKLQAASCKREGMITVLLSAWLMVFYGSWTLADPLVRATNVFTISYARYWLPMVFLLAPWAATGFLRIVSRVGRLRQIIAMLLVLGIALVSSQQIVTGTTEGLAQQRRGIVEHRTRARAVIAETPDDAIIVSHRMDKTFFPERAVVFVSEEPDADFLRHLAVLVETAPVYWYAPSRPAVVGFAFTSVGTMPFGEQLYRMGLL